MYNTPNKLQGADTEALPTGDKTGFGGISGPSVNSNPGNPPYKRSSE